MSSTDEDCETSSEVSLVENTNKRELRSRTIEINETDPSLRSLVKEGIWPTKIKGVSFTEETSTKKSIIALPDKVTDKTKMATSKSVDREVMYSANQDYERMLAMQTVHDDEIRQLKTKMHGEFDAVVQKGIYEQNRLREALDRTRTELAEKDEFVSRMESRQRDQRSTLPSGSVAVDHVCDVDEAFRRLQRSALSAGGSVDDAADLGVAAPTTTRSEDRLRVGLRSVSDSVIAPPPFTARQGVDAESWLENFERYCLHRRLEKDDMKTLFPLLLRESAADWLVTLPAITFDSYDNLKGAFKRNYFSPSELAWQIQGNLWKESQKEHERVDDYIMRIRKNARKLNLEPSTICDIITNGLRAELRMHVLLQRGSGLNPDLEDLVKYARLAEAVILPTSESSNNLLLEVMKATTASNGQQTKELRELSNKVTALTLAHEDRQINVIQGEARQGPSAPTQRVYKYSPQRQQKESWSQNQTSRSAAGGARGFRQQSTEENQQSGTCGRCGDQEHAAGASCRAMGVTCFRCEKPNHLANCCRSGRRQQSHRQQQRQF